MLPISEVRGGIPIGLLNGVHPLWVYIACCAANIVVVPLLFFFLEFINKYFLKMKWYKKLFDKFVERARHKVHKKVEKYGYLGLLLFTAIPLPVTGAYTATLGAWFFEMNKKKAFVAIAGGVLVSGIIVMVVALTGAEAFKFFIK